jgi:SPP1 gp7 family putative phage head morphogenesis protein
MEEMLHSRINLVQKMFTEFAGPAIREFQSELDEQREDAAALDVQDVLVAIRGVLPGMAEADAEGLRFIGAEIDEDVTSATEKELSRLFNIPLATAAGSEAQVQDWIHANVQLITRMNQETLDKIEQLVSEAVSGGIPTGAMARPGKNTLLDRIEQRFNVGRSRASLIARDQTAKLASQINRERQTAVGITHFVWSTSGDARVRQSHADLDGRIFSWAEGAVNPETGETIWPGTDFQCRCDAIPVKPDADQTAILAEAEEVKRRELKILQSSPTVRGLVPNYSGFTDWNRKRIRKLREGLGSAVGL